MASGGFLLSRNRILCADEEKRSVEKKERQKQALTFTSGAPFSDMTSYVFLAPLEDEQEVAIII